MKRCSKCGQEYPGTSEFFDNAGRGKLKAYCKECRRRFHRIRSDGQRYSFSHDGVRTCPKCARQFPATTGFFFRCSRNRHGLTYLCKQCQRSYVKAWRLKHLDHERERERRYAREKQQKHPDLVRMLRRADYRRLYDQMIVAYGGVCRCCGESTKEFLTLQHKNGTGKPHRSRFNGRQLSAVRDLRRRGWPREECELLCWNCHRAIDIHGSCPHGRTLLDLVRSSQTEIMMELN